jgi:hypothetical protein
LTSAVKVAAESPLPVTSPTTSATVSSSTANASKKSPPISASSEADS